MRTCLVGLHDSGKSTALAALWFSVGERSKSCDWYLANSDRPSDASRWTELRDLWLRGSPPQRTEHIPSPHTLNLNLSKEGSDDKLNITVPDIAGEDFEKLYEHGRFPKKHSTIISNSEHIVFFIHVANYDVPIALKAPNLKKTATTEEREPSNWQAEKLYPDSKIVAVLRGIHQLCSGTMPRITIVLTAWDLIEDKSTPRTIIRRRFPLLHQYLESNCCYKLVALSAQGYDYDNPESLDDVQLDDIKRILVIDNEKHNDLTRIFS